MPETQKLVVQCLSLLVPTNKAPAISHDLNQHKGLQQQTYPTISMHCHLPRGSIACRSWPGHCCWVLSWAMQALQLRSPVGLCGGAQGWWEGDWDMGWWGLWMRTLTGSAVKGFFESFSHQKAEGFHFMNLVETTRHNQLSQVNIKEGQQCQLQSCLASSRVLEWNFQSPTKELVERHKMMNTEPLDCQVCYGFLLQRKQVACRGGHQILCLEHVHLRRRSWESFPNLYQPIFWFLGTIRDFYLSLSLSLFLHIYLYLCVYI